MGQPFAQRADRPSYRLLRLAKVEATADVAATIAVKKERASRRTQPRVLPLALSLPWAVLTAVPSLVADTTSSEVT